MKLYTIEMYYGESPLEAALKNGSSDIVHYLHVHVQLVYSFETIILLGSQYNNIVI